MKNIVAICNGHKVIVMKNLPDHQAGLIRRDLQNDEQNFDMFGNQICQYRLVKSQVFILRVKIGRKYETFRFDGLKSQLKGLVLN